jgi:hypothetical protein
VAQAAAPAVYNTYVEDTSITNNISSNGYLDPPAPEGNGESSAYDDLADTVDDLHRDGGGDEGSAPATDADSDGAYGDLRDSVDAIRNAPDGGGEGDPPDAEPGGITTVDEVPAADLLPGAADAGDGAAAGNVFGANRYGEGDPAGGEGADDYSFQSRYQSGGGDGAPASEVGADDGTFYGRYVGGDADGAPASEGGADDGTFYGRYVGGGDDGAPAPEGGADDYSFQSRYQTGGGEEQGAGDPPDAGSTGNVLIGDYFEADPDAPPEGEGTDPTFEPVDETTDYGASDSDSGDEFDSL